MAKISNSIEICNLALLRIGQSSIARFDRSSPQAIACENAYEHAKGCVLSETWWLFAVKKISLNKISDNSGKVSTDPGYDHTLLEYGKRFARPEGMISLICLYDNTGRPVFGNGSVTPAYGVDSAGILYNYEPCIVKYIYDIDDVNVFPSPFIECLKLRLAYEIAPAFKVSESVLSGIQNEYVVQLSNAKKLNTRQAIMISKENPYLITNGF